MFVKVVGQGACPVRYLIVPSTASQCCADEGSRASPYFYLTLDHRPGVSPFFLLWPVYVGLYSEDGVAHFSALYSGHRLHLSHCQ